MFSVLSLRSVNVRLAVRSSRFFHLIYCQTWGNQFFKLLIYIFFIEGLKHLSIMAPALRWMFLVMQERLACYAHTWHLPVTALHLPLFTAEPSQTLLFPASSRWGKQALHTSWESSRRCIIPWLFLILCDCIHHLWDIYYLHCLLLPLNIIIQWWSHAMFTHAKYCLLPLEQTFNLLSSS